MKKVGVWGVLGLLGLLGQEASALYDVEAWDFEEEVPAAPAPARCYMGAMGQITRAAQRCVPTEDLDSLTPFARFWHGFQVARELEADRIRREGLWITVGDHPLSSFIVLMQYYQQYKTRGGEALVILEELVEAYRNYHGSQGGNISGVRGAERRQ